MPKLPFDFPPKPPKISGLLKGRNPLRQAVDEARSLVKEGHQVVRDVADGLRVTPEETSYEPTESPGGKEASGEVATLKYQLELLLDDLQHLETEHLPQKGRIKGVPCDCIGKAARDLRRHAIETIPIASRQGKDPRIFSELAKLSERLITIGSVEAVKSGLWDEEYLRFAGVVSKYRKRVSELLGECERCGEPEDLRSFIERRKRGGIKEEKIRSGTDVG